MSAETEDEAREVSFEPEDVRRRLPGDATDRQKRALICAVRNPDASPFEIAHAAAVERGEVVRTLSNVAHGVIGDGNEGHRQARERRGGARHAHNYAELTDKQRAIVDYRARYDPEFGMSGAAVARGINSLDKYDANLDTTTVPSFENNEPYASRLDSFVQERRDILLARGDIEGEDDEDEANRAAHRLETRDYLELAGFVLPDENLDSLERVGEGLDDEAKLDLAFKNGNEVGEPERDEGAVIVEPGEAENHVHDETFGDGDVRAGQAYEGVVNGVVGWGVWVTIAGNPESASDVSGVLSKERLAEAGREVEDYAEGDDALVVPTGRANKRDGKVRHRFRLGRYAEDLADEDEPTALEYEEPDGAAQGEDDPRMIGRVQTGGFPAEAAFDVPTLEAFEDLRETVHEQGVHIDALERENERLAEQVEENAEALPTPEQARELNEAAETVAGADDLLARLEAWFADDPLETGSKPLAEELREVREDLDELADNLDIVKSTAASRERANGTRERLAEVEGDLTEVVEYIVAIGEGEDLDELDEPDTTLTEVTEELRDVREQFEDVDAAAAEALNTSAAVEDRLDDETDRDDLAHALAVLREHGDVDVQVNL